jgi:lipoprotein-anchoring transpeptidase ErfK/SrfK
MPIFKSFLIICFAVVLPYVSASAGNEGGASGTQIVVSVAEQKLALIRNGEVIKKYVVSTSKFGLGDSFGSYRTPLGSLRISEKIGAGLPAGAVIKHRSPTGEVLRPNAPGRDPIVSRILWLDGQERANQNAHGRGVYIHGTTDEKRLGRPASYGCIRMKSRDVIELYATIPVGTDVSIVKGALPGSNLLVALFASVDTTRRGNGRL